MAAQQGNSPFKKLLEIKCFQAGRRSLAHRLFIRLCLERGELVRKTHV